MQEEKPSRSEPTRRAEEVEEDLLEEEPELPVLEPLGAEHALERHLEHLEFRQFTSCPDVPPLPPQADNTLGVYNRDHGLTLMLIVRQAGSSIVPGRINSSVFAALSNQLDRAVRIATIVLPAECPQAIVEQTALMRHLEAAVVFHNYIVVEGRLVAKHLNFPGMSRALRVPSLVMAFLQKLHQYWFSGNYTPSRVTNDLLVNFNLSKDIMKFYNDFYISWLIEHTIQLNPCVTERNQIERNLASFQIYRLECYEYEEDEIQVECCTREHSTRRLTWQHEVTLNINGFGDEQQTGNRLKRPHPDAETFEIRPHNLPNTTVELNATNNPQQQLPMLGPEDTKNDVPSTSKVPKHRRKEHLLKFNSCDAQSKLDHSYEIATGVGADVLVPASRAVLQSSLSDTALDAVSRPQTEDTNRATPPLSSPRHDVPENLESLQNVPLEATYPPMQLQSHQEVLQKIRLIIEKLKYNVDVLENMFYNKRRLESKQNEVDSSKPIPRSKHFPQGPNQRVEEPTLIDEQRIATESCKTTDKEAAESLLDQRIKFLIDKLRQDFTVFDQELEAAENDSGKTETDFSKILNEIDSSQLEAMGLGQSTLLAAQLLGSEIDEIAFKKLRETLSAQKLLCIITELTITVNHLKNEVEEKRQLLNEKNNVREKAENPINTKPVTLSQETKENSSRDEQEEEFLTEISITSKKSSEDLEEQKIVSSIGPQKQDDVTNNKLNTQTKLELKENELQNEVLKRTDSSKPTACSIETKEITSLIEQDQRTSIDKPVIVEENGKNQVKEAGKILQDQNLTSITAEPRHNVDLVNNDLEIEPEREEMQPKDNVVKPIYIGKVINFTKCIDQMKDSPQETKDNLLKAQDKPTSIEKPKFGNCFCKLKVLKVNEDTEDEQLAFIVEHFAYFRTNRSKDNQLKPDVVQPLYMTEMDATKCTAEAVHFLQVSVENNPLIEQDKPALIEEPIMVEENGQITMMNASFQDQKQASVEKPMRQVDVTNIELENEEHQPKKHLVEPFYTAKEMESIKSRGQTENFLEESVANDPLMEQDKAASIEEPIIAEENDQITVKNASESFQDQKQASIEKSRHQVDVTNIGLENEEHQPKKKLVEPLYIAKEIESTKLIGQTEVFLQQSVENDQLMEQDKPASIEEPIIVEENGQITVKNASESFQDQKQASIEKSRHQVGVTNIGLENEEHQLKKKLVEPLYIAKEIESTKLIGQTEVFLQQSVENDQLMEQDKPALIEEPIIAEENDQITVKNASESFQDQKHASIEKSRHQVDVQNVGLENEHQPKKKLVEPLYIAKEIESTKLIGQTEVFLQQSVENDQLMEQNKPVSIEEPIIAEENDQITVKNASESFQDQKQASVEKPRHQVDVTNIELENEEHQANKKLVEPLYIAKEMESTKSIGQTEHFLQESAENVPLMEQDKPASTEEPIIVEDNCKITANNTSESVQNEKQASVIKKPRYNVDFVKKGPIRKIEPQSEAIQPKRNLVKPLYIANKIDAIKSITQKKQFLQERKEIESLVEKEQRTSKEKSKIVEKHCVGTVKKANQSVQDQKLTSIIENTKHNVDVMNNELKSEENQLEKNENEPFYELKNADSSKPIARVKQCKQETKLDNSQIEQVQPTSVEGPKIVVKKASGSRQGQQLASITDKPSQDVDVINNERNRKTKREGDEEKSLNMLKMGDSSKAMPPSKPGLQESKEIKLQSEHEQPTSMEENGTNMSRKSSGNLQDRKLVSNIGRDGPNVDDLKNELGSKLENKREKNELKKNKETINKPKQAESSKPVARTKQETKEKPFKHEVNDLRKKEKSLNIPKKVTSKSIAPTKYCQQETKENIAISTKHLTPTEQPKTVKENDLLKLIGPNPEKQQGEAAKTQQSSIRVKTPEKINENFETNVDNSVKRHKNKNKIKNIDGLLSGPTEDAESTAVKVEVDKPRVDIEETDPVVPTSKRNTNANLKKNVNKQILSTVNYNKYSSKKFKKDDGEKAETLPEHELVSKRSLVDIISKEKLTDETDVKAILEERGRKGNIGLITGKTIRKKLHNINRQNESLERGDGGREQEKHQQNGGKLSKKERKRLKLLEGSNAKQDHKKKKRHEEEKTDVVAEFKRRNADDNNRNKKNQKLKTIKPEVDTAAKHSAEWTACKKDITKYLQDLQEVSEKIENFGRESIVDDKTKVVEKENVTIKKKEKGKNKVLEQKERKNVEKPLELPQILDMDGDSKQSKKSEPILPAEDSNLTAKKQGTVPKEAAVVAKPSQSDVHEQSKVLRQAVEAYVAKKKKAKSKPETEEPKEVVEIKKSTADVLEVIVQSAIAKTFSTNKPPEQLTINNLSTQASHPKILSSTMLERIWFDTLDTVGTSSLSTCPVQDLLRDYKKIQAKKNLAASKSKQAHYRSGCGSKDKCGCPEVAIVCISVFVAIRLPVAIINKLVLVQEKNLDRAFCFNLIKLHPIKLQLASCVLSEQAVEKDANPVLKKFIETTFPSEFFATIDRSMKEFSYEKQWKVLRSLETRYNELDLENIDGTFRELTPDEQAVPSSKPSKIMISKKTKLRAVNRRDKGELVSRMIEAKRMQKENSKQPKKSAKALEKEVKCAFDCGRPVQMPTATKRKKIDGHGIEECQHVEADRVFDENTDDVEDDESDEMGSPNESCDFDPEPPSYDPPPEVRARWHAEVPEFEHYSNNLATLQDFLQNIRQKLIFGMITKNVSTYSTRESPDLFYTATDNPETFTRAPTQHEVVENFTPESFNPATVKGFVVQLNKEDKKSCFDEISSRIGTYGGSSPGMEQVDKHANPNDLESNQTSDFIESDKTTDIGEENILRDPEIAVPRPLGFPFAYVTGKTQVIHNIIRPFDEETEEELYRHEVEVEKKMTELFSMCELSRFQTKDWYLAPPRHQSEMHNRIVPTIQLKESHFTDGISYRKLGYRKSEYRVGSRRFIKVEHIAYSLKLKKNDYKLDYNLIKDYHVEITNSCCDAEVLVSLLECSINMDSLDKILEEHLALSVLESAVFHKLNIPNFYLEDSHDMMTLLFATLALDKLILQHSPDCRNLAD